MVQMPVAEMPDGAVTIAPYLSAEELAAVTPWTVDAIEKMIARGVLVKDVHFFQPFGPRSQRIFKWSAIEALIEGSAAPVASQRVVHGTPAMAPPKTLQAIDVEKATTEIQRLLG
jgi:hypothetical protein